MAFIYGNDADADTFEYTINNKTLNFGKSYSKYYLNINDEKIYFYNLPDKADFNISDNILAKIINTRMFYLTFNPTQEELTYIDLMRFDLSNEFYKKNIYIVNSVTNETNNYQLPVITCNNATDFVPVISLEVADKQNIEYYDNCLIFQGKGLDFIKFRDYLIYKLYEVY